ncbi:hypothetical protein Ae201684_003936 [Aphanomyces euteiches]|uniref:Uncharacterized protein n=1 Tax=Aphanomyces euteiches TaxID=100861 RepID=A0A6G0XK88_9STRA|nr:hypothetical protein Ae201684_003936 [Aphanomyces euteiches]
MTMPTAQATSEAIGRPGDKQTAWKEDARPAQECGRKKLSFADEHGKALEQQFVFDDGEPQDHGSDLRSKL